MGVLVALAWLVVASAASAQGPQATGACPPGAVDLWPGSDLPGAARAYPEGTAFCVRAGVHAPTAPINVRAGQQWVGEFGAIIDGSRRATTCPRPRSSGAGTAASRARA